MSLNWGIEKVANWEKISMAEENGIEGAKTRNLVWATMAVDMGEITAKNVDEFWRRFAPKAADYTVRWITPGVNDGESTITEHPITREDIVRRIGMWTNVATIGPRKYAAREKLREKNSKRYK